MANKKISELAEITVNNATDLLVIVQNGATKKIQVSNLSNYDFTNGLVTSEGLVGLGGTLVSDTEINGDSGDYSFSIKNLSSLATNSEYTNLQSYNHAPGSSSVVSQLKIDESIIPFVGSGFVGSNVYMLGTDASGATVSMGSTITNDDQPTGFIVVDDGENKFRTTHEYKPGTSNVQTISQDDSSSTKILQEAQGASSSILLQTVTGAFQNGVKVQLLGEDLNIELLGSGNVNISGLPKYKDDADAGAGGLAPDDLYVTDGGGGAPLNVAGILMIKQ